MMETIMNWIRGVDDSIHWTLESLSGLPGSGGLFCRGEEEVSRREDILGGAVIRRRLTVVLALTECWDDHGDNTVTQRLLDFGREALGSAPVFGPNQHVRTQNARLTRATPDGTARAEINLVFEYDTVEG